MINVSNPFCKMNVVAYNVIFKSTLNVGIFNTYRHLNVLHFFLK